MLKKKIIHLVISLVVIALPGLVRASSFMGVPASGAASPVDGYLHCGNDSWARCAAETDADDVSESDSTNVIGAVANGDYRGAYCFDTSELGGGQTVNSGTLVLHDNGGGEGTPSMGLVTFDPVATNDLAASDYEFYGTTELATRVTFGSAGDKTFTLNSAGRLHINQTGVTCFGVREAHSIDNSSPGAGVYTIIVNADNGSNKPTLTLDYSEGGGGGESATSTPISVDESPNIYFFGITIFLFAFWIGRRL